MHACKLVFLEILVVAAVTFDKGWFKKDKKLHRLLKAASKSPIFLHGLAASKFKVPLDPE